MANESAYFHIKNECGLGIMATWSTGIISAYNESNKNIRGECATLSNSYSETFTILSGSNTLLTPPANSIVFIVWKYDPDL